MKTKHVQSELFICDKCLNEFTNMLDLASHMEVTHPANKHTQEKAILKEQHESVPEVFKSPPLNKCNVYSFASSTTVSLSEHKKDKHNKEEAVTGSSIFLHACISCDFKTDDYNNLRIHIDTNH